MLQGFVSYMFLHSRIKMEKHLKLLDHTCCLCKNTIVLKRGYVTPKTCYDYADVLKNFFGVLITEEDRTVSYTIINFFLFYLLFTYSFGFSVIIRLCGRLISATPSIKSVQDLGQLYVCISEVSVLIFKIKVPFSQIFGCGFSLTKIVVWSEGW